MSNVVPLFKEPKGPTWAEGRAAVVLRANGRCEANAHSTCTGRHEVTHHKRGRRVPNAHHPDHLLACCDPCHSFAHANPAAAYALGLMERRTT